MPRGDGTGPMGYGPMTGRGMGFCAVRVGASFVNRIGFGRAMGQGRGWGMGWRNRFNGFGATRPMGYGRNVSAWNIEDDVSAMEQEAQAMEVDLNELRARIEQLKSAPKDQ